MESTLHDESVAGVFRELLAGRDEGLFVSCSSGPDVRDLINVLGALDERPTVRLLAPRGILKDVMEDFMMAGAAADLAEDGALSIRSSDERGGTLVVAPDAVASVVEAGDRVAALSTDDEEFLERAEHRFEDAWDAAGEYQVRTPPLSRVQASLETDIGPETAADFEAVLESLGTVRGDAGLDEVTISLLVAAKNQDLLYDISKWGEDVGIASKATFSRTKTKLEDMGLIDTEKVPIDVGRPRLRLLLGDDRLEDADPNQLASVAQSMLAS